LLGDISTAMDETKAEHEPLEAEAKQAASSIAAVMSLKLMFGAFAESQNPENSKASEAREALMGKDEDFEARRAASDAKTAAKQARAEAREAAKAARAANNETDLAEPENEPAEEEEAPEADAAGLFRLLEFFGKAAASYQDVEEVDQTDNADSESAEDSGPAADEVQSASSVDGTAAPTGSENLATTPSPAPPATNFKIEHDEL
jgi:hypothetical protein